ncbi:MAG TPA: pyridoxal 5'-phosphate synthase glutaminase subunit PdxT [Anaerolineaceae bacterium]|nr:pyridoxal 5'-phosphate synthase glutaminase subunit PdxT [Anaerolineaceae bacterium]
MTRLGAVATQVRLAQELEGLDGLIIPGGESTTMGKLALDFGLLEPLRIFGQTHAIWGTCAGAILLSRDARRNQPLLGLMDVTVERNAFGRQTESFEVDLNVSALSTPERPFHAVFIRAPLIESVGPTVQTLAILPMDYAGRRPDLGGKIVAAQQGRLLATSFHPELTPDDRFHRYFMELAA